jgi:methylglutaconyl-CoA hydratase
VSGGGVRLVVDGGCAVLELDRPDQLNAVDSAMADSVVSACEELAPRDDVRIVVLRGRGRVFSAGGDIHEFRDLAQRPEDDRREALDRYVRMLDALEGLPQLTVAVVHGLAAGMGVSLVSRCDIALAGESARFALPELSIGLVPGLVLLDAERVMPDKQARDWLVTGRPRTAEQAREAGLVSRVVPDADLESAVSDLVTTVTSGPPCALRTTFDLYRAVQADRNGAARQLAVQEAVLSLGSAEAHEGFAAFAERRPPGWPS